MTTRDTIIDRVCIYYGSQTGNAEEISRQLYGELFDETDSSIHVTCEKLNSISIESIATIWNNASTLVIIVCSTTGNGDFPDNAEKFWRNIKKRTIANDFLHNTHFALLGLGDTNYDKFCNAGNKLHKRMIELRATSVLPIACADEATGLEEVVESWMTTIIEKITTSYSQSSGSW
jgi:sulfite reductase alpha subunit-like flavoprotein